MKRSSIVVAVTVAVLVIVTYAHWLLVHLAGYRRLHDAAPFYVAESIDKMGGVALCIAAGLWLRRANARSLWSDLGLAGAAGPALAFAALASVPMWIGFVLTRRFMPANAVVPLLFLTVLSPMVEEFEFRGFGVLQLTSGARLPFWLAVWPSTFLFGLAHIEQGHDAASKLALLVLTGTGGLVYAWVAHRWRSLWAAIGLHVSMNLSWELFSVSRTAIGGWFPFALQTSTILLAIGLTLWSPLAHTATALSE